MTDGVAQEVRILANRYQVGDLIGRGGMADVHVGTDTRLNRRVAIKLLRSSLAEDPAFRARFRREAQDAAKMAHPTIVRIFDAGEETVVDSQGYEVIIPFIVMEYVDGRLLRDLIEDGPLEPSIAISMVSQVLTALEYSHRAGVVHRDIKPGNIMIAANGQVKVMDFGVARAVTESTATIAETSVIVGTAQYFSPEQARGESVDARTDLYSTGVVLYELLTGAAPFRGDNPVAVAYQHVNSDPTPPSLMNPKVSPALDAVVLRALAKDRFERYQSAATFRNDLEAAATGELPRNQEVARADFNSTLFGMNPNQIAASETAFRQISAAQEDRSPRTQSRPPVAWIWAGVLAMAAIIVAVVFWAFSLQPVQLAPEASVSVPDVVGMSNADALATLDGVGLTTTVREQASETVAENVVISTSPASGLSVEPGATVQVVVSLGVAPVTMPFVANLPEGDALAAIEAAGLTYNQTTQEHSPNVPQGVVIRTSPEGGAQRNAEGALIRRGQPVDLVISNGLVMVPDVTGKTVDVASQELSAQQITVRIVSDFSCSGGIVVAQTAVGEQQQRSEVTLTSCIG